MTESPIKNTLAQLQDKAKKQGIHYGLEHLYPILEDLGNPHEQCENIIHIAGTNGKGSVTTYMRAILEECGLRVGSYTSPHLTCYTERIAINDEPISEHDFQRYFEKLEPFLAQLTEFETLTCMAFLYFADTKPDYILLETGLGGRLDATNVCKPLISIITKIDKDHMSILGETLTKIATEKAGIIKANTPTITLNTQPQEVQKVIESVAATKQSPIRLITPLESIPETYAMQGDYQKENIALAKEAIKCCLGYSRKGNRMIESGLQKAELFGRFSIKKSETQTLIFDGAHNAAAMHTVLHSIDQHFPQEPLQAIIGIQKTKDITTLVPPLLEKVSQLYYYAFDESTHDYQTIQDHYPHIKIYEWTPNTPLPNAKLLLITGSLYYLKTMQAYAEKAPLS